MKMCVEARNVYLAGGGHLNLKEFWRRERMLEKHGIPYSNYWTYANDKALNRFQHIKVSDMCTVSVTCWMAIFSNQLRRLCVLPGTDAAT